MEYIPERIIIDARLQIARALVQSGPSGALACVAAQSIRLCRYVAEGNLVEKCGKAAVKNAIYAGPDFYTSLPAMEAA